MKIIALLLALSAYPGQAVVVEIPFEPELEAVTLEWQAQEISMARADSGWFALLGVDLDVAPGPYEVDAVFRYAGNRQERRTLALTVTPKEYPTTRLTVEPKYVELSPANQKRAAQDKKRIEAAYATTAAEPYWTDVFTVPIPGVTGGRNFGHRRVFNDQPRAPHSGADLTAAEGTEIRSTNRGRVVLTGDFFFNGNAVFVDHGMGVLSMYLHLSKILVEEGQLVERGELLGLAGATGRVTGPHLHWGVKVTGARVDPFTLPGFGAATATPVSVGAR
ncbi:MAG: M23 family metallopeptidase [Gammaproteobacteria bacterium]|jgi:murein DD-endopeptidase MepM/ murein hydrolase activator NlpD